MYKLTWYTSFPPAAGTACGSLIPIAGTFENTLFFPTWEEARANAEARLIENGWLKGEVWPNYPALADADDRLYWEGNTYAGITEVS